MTTTNIAWGDPKAQKKWGAGLATEVNRTSYWKRRGFIGTGQNSIIEEKRDLVSDTGDRISFDLSVNLREQPTFGDNTLDGKEEGLRFFTDEVVIDQMRKSVSAGGKMTRKRVIHNLRTVAKDRLSEYWQQYIDEIIFVYMSGARGINEEFRTPTSYTGFASNALTAPDATHQLYGGSATTKATITTADIMSRNLIERAATHAVMIRALNQDACDMVPVSIGGESRFIVVMSPYQSYQLRNLDTNGWVQLQRDAAAAEGRDNPLFKGALGMIGNVILHDHGNAIRFSDYGAGTNLAAARALFMARQAGVIAYGTPQGMRFAWEEELKDFKNNPVCAAGVIMGLKKTQFNNLDFGVIALDTYAPKPVGA